MRFLVVLLFSTLITQQVIAHGNHRPTATDEQALAVAVQVTQGFAGVDPMLGFGPLSETWKNVGLATATIHKRGRSYLIVKIVNSAERQPLYILMSEEGEVFDANQTGDFNELQ